MGVEAITIAPRTRRTEESVSVSDPNAGERRLPRPGEVVDGKYRVVRVLGKGGMGVVLEADHLVLGHRVALKFLHPSLVETEAAKRFAHEARAAAGLRSDHATRIYDVDRLPWGAPYIVMEHLEGASLERVLVERGPIPWQEAVAWMAQACRAVAEAHARAIVHRDLKPANLFLTRHRGEALVKVLDFGLAKSLDRSAPADAETEGATAAQNIRG